jgi:arylsulfatase A-like enzyme
LFVSVRSEDVLMRGAFPALLLAAVLCCSTGSPPPARAADESADATTKSGANRPNVIFFLSDDHRAGFLSCAGHPVVKTPTIDKLAAGGVRFENAFATTSICAASRATLFTGLWERSHKYTFGTPPLGVELIEQSYPVRLKKAGYRTGFVGKFGVGVPKGAQERMFDVFVPLGRSPYFKEQPDGTRRHLTDITGDKAIDFLRTCVPDEPFCLSVSFNAAHAEDGDTKHLYPYPPSEEGLYADLTMPPPTVAVDFWKTLPAFFHDCMHRDRYFWGYDTPEKYQHNARNYYRMITGLDRNIGRVLDELAKRKLADETVVIFAGDNGYYLGSRGFQGKWSHFEESLRVPLVVYDPRLPEPLRGRTAEQIALNVDVPATILDVATGEVPASYQGRSLVPILQGKAPADWRTDFFCEHLMVHADIPQWEGVRGERYKYARYFEHLPEGEFLHDLKADPHELKNLATDPAHAELLETMRRRCDELRGQLGGKYTPEEFPTTRPRRPNRPMKGQ